MCTVQFSKSYEWCGNVSVIHRWCGSPIVEKHRTTHSQNCINVIHKMWCMHTKWIYTWIESIVILKKRDYFPTNVHVENTHHNPTVHKITQGRMILECFDMRVPYRTLAMLSSVPASWWYDFVDHFPRIRFYLTISLFRVHQMVLIQCIEPKARTRI